LWNSADQFGKRVHSAGTDEPTRQDFKPFNCINEAGIVLQEFGLIQMDKLGER
jgi:hypothetical protein